MDVVAAGREDRKEVAALLQHALLLEGKELSSHQMKKLLKNVFSSGGFFVLKHEGRVMGCVGVRADQERAEVHSFALSSEAVEMGYGELFVEKIIEQCLPDGAAFVSGVILRSYESLFVRKGFFVNDKRVTVEMKILPAERQRNLGTTLKEIEMVKDIEGKTAETLRGLKTRK